jgi:hypothetical protein
LEESDGLRPVLGNVFEPRKKHTPFPVEILVRTVQKSVSISCPFACSFLMLYNCSCGKKHKSRTTVLKHKSKYVQTDVQMNVQMDKMDKTKSPRGQSVLKEINLLEVYKKMTETINPKKDEKKEPAYQCGACKGTFEEKYKRCPHCGAEF